MPGNVRKSMRDKTIHSVMLSNLSDADKTCIFDIFVRYEHMLDSVTVKHGRWKTEAGSLLPFHSCSLCNYSIITGKTNYCPNCGAKMDFEEGAE